MNEIERLSYKILKEIFYNLNINIELDKELLEITKKSILSDNFFDPMFSLFTMSKVNDRCIKFIKDILDINKKLSILDCGSGVGRYSIYLANWKDINMFSYEKNKFGYNIQKKIKQERQLSNLVIKNDDFNNNDKYSFNLILCMFTTLYDANINSLKKNLENFKAFLKKDGFLIYETILLDTIECVFKNEEISEWQFGIVKKKYYIKNEEISLVWQWSFDDRIMPITKKYSFVPPQKKDIESICKDFSLSIIRKEIISDSDSLFIIKKD